jgi:flagellar biosynthesis/type III secretory pathway chaperone
MEKVVREVLCILEEENKHLSEGQLQEVGVLLARKTMALARLEQVRSLLSSGERKISSANHQKIKLLEDVMAENQRLLKIAINAQSRVVKILSDALTDDDSSSRYQSYGGRADAISHGRSIFKLNI